MIVFLRLTEVTECFIDMCLRHIGICVAFEFVDPIQEKTNWLALFGSAFFGLCPFETVTIFS